MWQELLVAPAKQSYVCIWALYVHVCSCFAAVQDMTVLANVCDDFDSL